MTTTPTLSTYADVRAVLDAALANGGGRYKLATKAEATRWRFRAYRFRKLLREETDTYTPYDNMLLRVDGPVVFIQTQQITGVLTDLEGKPVEVKEKHPLEYDDLLSEALDFSEKLDD